MNFNWEQTFNETRNEQRKQLNGPTAYYYNVDLTTEQGEENYSSYFEIKNTGDEPPYVEMSSKVPEGSVDEEELATFKEWQDEDVSSEARKF